MKVVFDISVLGLAHVNPVSRTGVYRVVENVLQQLYRHSDTELTFISNRDEETLEYSLNYWKSAKTASSVPFSRPLLFARRRQLPLRISQRMHQLVNDSSLSYFQKTRLRLDIKRLLGLQRIYGMFGTALYHSSDLRKADIYHSPFFPLPDRRIAGVNTKFFVTCYDLIPVLYPHFFPDSLVTQFTEILDSLDAETWVLCISTSTRNDLLGYMGSRLDPDKVVVTSLAASDNFYPSTDKAVNLAMRQKYQIPDVPYLLSVCTLEPRKNIDQVIKAFAKLMNEGRAGDLHLVLVGVKGWKFEKIFEELTRSEELKKRIIITGFVADEDLAALYSGALFFVYTSFYEGFGLPPLEAMKCGIPVITSNTSSLPEVVGDAGLMVSPTALEELCEAMMLLYNNVGLRKEMGQKSLQQASRFSWEQCGLDTIAAYKRSLQHP